MSFCIRLRSKNPLSDPQTSKADERLAGVWLNRGGDGDVYYHVGHAGDKFPACMMRVVGIKHSKGNVESVGEFLIFPTILGDKSYLNVVIGRDDKLVKSLDEKGWKAADVDNYTLYRYKFDGDKLVVYGIDAEAKKRRSRAARSRGLWRTIRPSSPTPPRMLLAWSKRRVIACGRRSRAGWSG